MELDQSQFSVLDVGSLDMNGSLRSFFKNANYTGIDFRNGPGVDHVVNSHNLKNFFGDKQFDVVICTELLEHDDAFWITMEQINFVLKPGGILLLTCRGNGMQEHGAPYDYWRFLPKGIESLLKMFSFLPVVIQEDFQVGHPGILSVSRKS